MLSANNPESGAITYAYDANSNLQSKVAPHPNTATGTVTTNFTYDSINRVITKGFVGMSVSAQKYGYDGTAPAGCQFAPPTISPAPKFLIGRLSAMCDGWGTDSSWGYDSMGRILTLARSLTGPSVSKSISYQYNFDGSPLSITYPSGNVVTYNVGGAGRELSVTDPNNNYVEPDTTGCSQCTNNGIRPDAPISAFGEYAPFGGLASVDLGLTSASKNIYVGNVYTNRLQLNSTVAGGSVYILELSYDFHLGSGDNGELFTRYNEIDNNRTQYFTYDPLNRLTQAYTNGPNWGETFTTDVWGNMWNRTGVTGKALYEQLTAPAKVTNQLTGFSYDGAGNLIKNGSTSYTYDPENHLSTVNGWTYTYNNDGQRVRKSNGTTGTVYWGGSDGNTLAETDLNGNGTEEYIFFDGKRVARRDLPSGTVHYYFSDDIGSNDVVTNATGTTVEEDLDYYPYGGIVAGGTDNVPQNYKFTGKERDAESGLDNFDFRYFGSSMGRFMSPDDDSGQDSGDPQSWNLYSYVRNNPLNRTDPDGHDCIHINTDSGKFEGFESGDCDNSTEEKANSGIYVDGTINSLQFNSSAGSLDFGYTDANGNVGAGTILGVAQPQKAAPINDPGMIPGMLGPGDLILFSGVKLPSVVTDLFGKLFGSILGKGAGDAAETAAKIVPEVDNLSNKIVRQMVTRGWTKQEILDTVNAGKAFPVVNKATGGAATEYVSASGKFVVVDNATKQVIQVSGPGFLPNHMAP